MNVRRTLLYAILVVGILVSGSLVFAGGGASQTSECQPIEDRHLCLDELTVSSEQLVIGEQGEFSVTVVNEGNSSATGELTLNTAGPDNETNAYEVEELTLEPGETKTVSRAINTSTPGTHGLRLWLIEPSTQHVYDVSEIKTIEILEEHPKELGGPIDRTEIALGALLAAVLGMIYLGYRQLNS